MERRAAWIRAYPRILTPPLGDVKKPATIIPVQPGGAVLAVRLGFSDRELRGSADLSGEARGSETAGNDQGRSRTAALLQIQRGNAPGRPDQLRGLHVRLRGLAVLARAALLSRVSLQVHRQVAQIESNLSNLPWGRRRVFR